MFEEGEAWSSDDHACDGASAHGAGLPASEPASESAPEPASESAPEPAPESASASASASAEPPEDSTTDLLRGLLDQPMSVEVLAALSRLEAEGLSPRDAVLALRLWDRASSWVAARTARSVVAVVPEPAGPRPAGGRLTAAELEAVVGHESARMEVACALRLSTAGARYRVEEAHALTSRPRTLAALETGDISPKHATTVVHELAVLDGNTAAQAVVEGEALARAAAGTVRSTRDLLRRRVLEVDPAAAQRRHAAAVADRRVALQEQPDGVIDLIASLEAGDALGAFEALTQAAELAWSPGDDRTLDQRRSDVVRDVLTGRAHLLPPLDADPDAPTDARPDTASRPAAATETAAPTGGPARRPGRRRRVPVGVVVAATTLAGADELPGELRGYGPVTAEQARRIAGRDGSLYRLLVDPLSGRLLDLGRQRYEPPEELKEHVRERDRTCRAPGCAADAVHTEVDHARKWADQGHTCDRNLHCGCGTHHRAKDHGGWTVEHTSDGTSLWTSPLGHTYVRPAATYTDLLPCPHMPHDAPGGTAGGTCGGPPRPPGDPPAEPPF